MFAVSYVKAVPSYLVLLARAFFALMLALLLWSARSKSALLLPDSYVFEPRDGFDEVCLSEFCSSGIIPTPRLPMLL